MYSIKSIILFLAFATLMSCSKESPLQTSITVEDHSNCNSDKVVLTLTAEGGSAPYIYQIKQLSDKKIIHTIETKEREVTLELQGLDQILYEVIVYDDILNKVTKPFLIKAEGTSSLSDHLHLEKDGDLYPMYNIPVNLFVVEGGTELYETTTTDRKGKFSFDNLPAALYVISFDVPEKYDDYKLVAIWNTDQSKLRTRRSKTEPFALNCRMNLNIDFLYRNK